MKKSHAIAVVDYPAEDIPQGLDPAFLDAPYFESTSKGALHRLGCLYNSPKWEHPNWNRTTQRSWKKNRKTPWK